MKCTHCDSEDTAYMAQFSSWICKKCDNPFVVVEDDSNKLQIFVSYGHDEYVLFARKVANELKIRGHEVWFDEEKLKPGTAWEEYIESGIE